MLQENSLVMGSTFAGLLCILFRWRGYGLLQNGSYVFMTQRNPNVKNLATSRVADQ